MPGDDIYQQLRGYYLDEIAPGMTAGYDKRIEDADVQAFAGLSGDVNPLHLNPAFARATRFGRPVVHGMVTTSLWSTIVGTRLPGPGCAYMSQELKFLKPVFVGDTVVASMTVTELETERQIVHMEALAHVGETLVACGHARVWVPVRGA
ncbi:MaoC family dehydratase [Parahaliea aestuarii]|uniref:MaoC family dehydratase n=1 Tax=Parahaliea aestuarii TaxID=1852021 RepID=A0A5C8ZUP1_9GAMM|nr:MaoC family dehydratase [Parahaliea aestuarii]TXS91187.1 MaoC family dehydratase [Parahaliea aestuarii]